MLVHVGSIVIAFSTRGPITTDWIQIRTGRTTACCRTVSFVNDALKFVVVCRLLSECETKEYGRKEE